MRKVKFGFIFMVLCMGCSRQQSIELPTNISDLENLTIYPIDAEPAYQIQFEREQTFGDTNDVFFGWMADAVVDETGRVYIADSEQLDIKVFEPDGNFLTRLGREGQGPGEFKNIWYLQVTANQLYAYDSIQKRSVVFSLDPLIYSHTINFGDDRHELEELSGASPGRYYARDDGTFLMQFSKVSHSETVSEQWHRVEYTGLYFFLNENGRIMSDKLFDLKAHINVLFQLQGMGMSVNPAFYGRSLVALSEDNHIYSARSDDYLIMIYSPNGEYQRTFYYPYKKAPLTQEAAINTESFEFFQEGIQLMELPETWPALDALLVDDVNRIWISTIEEDEEIYQWWVLQNTGELITKFEWPRNQPIEVVKNGYLFTRETDEETDLQQIVRYRIDVNM